MYTCVETSFNEAHAPHTPSASASRRPAEMTSFAFSAPRGSQVLVPRGRERCFRAPSPPARPAAAPFRCVGPPGHAADGCRRRFAFSTSCPGTEPFSVRTSTSSWSQENTCIFEEFLQFRWMQRCDCSKGPFRVVWGCCRDFQSPRGGSTQGDGGGSRP